MKKLIILFFTVTVLSSVSYTQEIAVQTSAGGVVTYNNLDKAILGAPAGSTIYLPAGNLTINDSVKITKKLTIIGVGYKTKIQGGSTWISGNFHYDQGCEGSSLIGVYLTGEVRLAHNSPVSNFLLRFCNIQNLSMGKDWGASTNIVINQNIIRNRVGSTFTQYYPQFVNIGNFGSITLSNNIISGTLFGCNGGIVEHNIFLFNGNSGLGVHYDWQWNYATIFNTSFRNNIFYYEFNGQHSVDGSSCFFQNNLGGSLSNDILDIERLNAIFVNGTGTLDGDYHIKEGMTGKNAGTDGTDVGIYGGSGFSDEALAPIPRIVSKSIPNQTDASGNLNISIKVRAAQ